MKFTTGIILALHTAGALSAAGGDKMFETEGSCPIIHEQYGCDQDSCWKQCGQQGSNQWCWLADDGGRGDWIPCSSESQCSPSSLKEQYGDTGCGVGDCDACGCGC